MSTSRTVAAPAAAVWQVIADHRTWTTWHAGYSEHEPIAERVRGLGAAFRTRDSGLRTETEITRWDDGSAVGLTLRRAQFWRWLISQYYSEVEIADDDVAGTATVHYRAAFSGTVLFWLTSAYSVGHALVTIWWDAKRSLEGLERAVTAG